MSLIDSLKEQVRGQGKIIVLPEYEDNRVLEGAAKVLQDGFCTPLLVGARDVICALADNVGVSLEGAIFIEPQTYEGLPQMIEEFVSLRAKKGMTSELAKEILLTSPLFFGAMLVRLKKADGMVAGSLSPTADVLRAAIQIVGMRAGLKTVSSSMVMLTRTPEYGEDGVLLFADCGVIPNPTAEQLADITISTVEKARRLVGMDDPRVALLSFSTKGSAQDPLVDKVVETVRILTERNVDFAFDGELQLDAAIDPTTASRKAPASPVAGRANILVFPDLQAANISYKLCQRFAKAQALGPLIQGLAAPVHDLSRGCSAQDIVDVVAIAASESLS